jgi:hypothetical protein
MKKDYKPCKIVSDKTTGNKYIYLIADDKSMPDTLDGLIALPDSFKVTLYVEPILKQLKKLGYTVKGRRFLSQKTGDVETELFIAI